MKTEILYEDSDILVIYKPAGIAVQTARAGQQDVVSELKNYLRQYRRPGEKSVPYLGIIHRLDQLVEGVLVFAKNKRAAAFLSQQLQKQGDDMAFHKQYYAVFCGKPPATEGELVDFLFKNRENKAEVAMGQETLDAKMAVLKYLVMQVEMVEIPSNKEAGLMQTKETAQIALADIQIRTGRFHQIRVQMAHAGMPLLGDFKYGDRDATELSQRLKVRNVGLCAYHITFLHPASNKEMHFEVEPRGEAFSYFGRNKSAKERHTKR